MKRWLIFLFLMCAFIGFVSSSVDVHDSYVVSVSSSNEPIKGSINLTVVGEDYDAKIKSNDGDEIGFREFLSLNGATFDCFPTDCSKGYKILGDITGESFSVPPSGKKTIGIVLYGEDVEVTGLEFNIESDFEESYRTPLMIEFFEEEIWGFSNFSNSFLSKEWGCYDKSEEERGPRVGVPLYCETIFIPDTNRLRVGADVATSYSDGDADDLKMTVYSESGIGSPKTCNFNPSNGEEYCLIEGLFSSANYYVCVNAAKETNYDIYEEDVGSNCGFVRSSSSESNTKDYAIFTQSVKYADFNSLESTIFNDGIINNKLVALADDIVLDKYDRNCSMGCFLPLVFSGLSQDVKITNLVLRYDEEGEIASPENKLYSLDVSPIKIGFDGVLNLSLLDFSISKTMNYIVSLEGKKLFNKSAEILSTPRILSVLPLNPPAGVPVLFYVRVEFDDNSSLSYKWDFGDGEIMSTSEPYVTHNYANLSSRILTLEVGAGWGLSSKKTFNVVPISPEIAVSMELLSKRSALDNINFSFSNSSFWYKIPLLSLINISFFENELIKLEVTKNNATTENDFIDIAKYLYILNIPARVNVNIEKGYFFLNEPEDVNIDVIATAGGKNYKGDGSDYLDPILSWQNKNIDISFNSKKFLTSLWNGDSNGVFNAYEFNLTSKNNAESYFVMDIPLDRLTFKENVGAKDIRNSTVIALQGNKNTSFEFYYEGEEAISFFVSPKLNLIVTESNTDNSCNYNFICESEYKENIFNCRNDCKPVKGAIIYVVIALIFVLILYTFLQVWYKRRYEKHLFKDRRQIYNLLMYISNARARGMKDSRIAAILREKGWSSERVRYIIKKSRGKRTGLFEIIPIEKISALSRNKKARNMEAVKVAPNNTSSDTVGNKNNIATGNR